MYKIVLLIALLSGCAGAPMIMDDGLPCERDGMANYVTQIHGEDVCIVSYYGG